MSETLEPLVITNPPEIYVYAVGAGYVGATINRLVNPAGHNVSDRYRTQMVLARTMDEVNSRIVSVLIQQFGMTQAEAASLVPSGVIPLGPVTGSGDELYLPLTGGQMLGPLLLAADPQQPLEAATQQLVMAPAMGITDGSNAAPGQIGEFLSAAVQPGSGIAAVTNGVLDVTTLLLTPGDWDLQGQVGTVAASGGHIQHMMMWMSPVSATVPSVFVGGFHEIGGIATGGTEQMVLPSGRMRMSVAAATTVYLSTKITFTGTLTCYGFISARRVR